MLGRRKARNLSSKGQCAVASKQVRTTNVTFGKKEKGIKVKGIRLLYMLCLGFCVSGFLS